MHKMKELRDYVVKAADLQGIPAGSIFLSAILYQEYPRHIEGGCLGWWLCFHQISFVSKVSLIHMFSNGPPAKTCRVTLGNPSTYGIELYNHAHRMT